nr:immunoglobulin light chain junction region [Macaca mulatta]MOX97987.1 immunoglobulin light chain junction region [Macaca mulatta]MOX99960.1 immunoglobulin light chain junction region [Macaca mulatta]MOY00013.1 immunoglobulin light chain junction region [Macaca mulatta]MOY00413.1 immunoglobulin light chain junction region [Macaca mulatta]
CLQYSSSPLTF